MMMKNGGSYYPSPYKTTPFNGMLNNFGVGSHGVPSFYNLQLQQGPQQQQQQQQQQQKTKKHLIHEQSHDTAPNILSFKLYDLDTTDNNEIIRLIFSFAGVSYKNKRLRQDEWIKIKEHMSFEHLPILRINHDFKIFQLHAIIRYLAREFHLYGTGQHDHAIVDIVYETIREFQEKISQQNNNSSINHEQTLHQLIIDISTIYLKQLENFYEIFNRHGPFYLGSHISLADLIVYDTINYLIKIDTKLLDNFSHLKEAYQRLEKHPRLLNYLNTKNNNNEIKKHHKSPHSHRHTTKSPVPNAPPHQHRHRSHEGHELGHRHYHHRHHHHHHHHRHNSKEPTPLLQTKQRSIISSKSPTISRKDIEQPPLVPKKKQPSVRSSQSPSVSTKDIEPAPPPAPQTKKRSIRSSKSPSSSRKDKEPTPLRATDVIPPPPPPPTIPQPPPPPINYH
ncbi:unnamed protein product [Rotaria sp. Silwood2]|nr:unnamed protein product [Rotaria sp. Silwood2]